MNREKLIRTPRLLLAAPCSGSGKTTVTCAILRALSARGMKLHSFKCGPDYIDPMFHRRVLGVSANNLDLFMLGEEGVKSVFALADEAELAVIEGVMGLYDGQNSGDDLGSSNHLARVLDAPSILIVSVRGMSLSLGALVSGYLGFLPNKIAGVILNGCSDSMYPVYEKMLRDTPGIKCFGYLPNLPEAGIESRHLGLITAAEITDLDRRLDLLAEAAEKCLDLDGLCELSRNAGEIRAEELPSERSAPRVRIGVARDAAFCFYYEEALMQLQLLGAELAEFSPLAERNLPPDIDAMIFGGGYPELYSEKLAQNEAMKAEILQAHSAGMPIIAECGGFMYLQKRFVDADGKEYPMVGIFQGESRMKGKLVRFGYCELTARADDLLCKEGETLRAHEFHYSDSTDNGSDYLAARRGKTWECLHADESGFYGYPHINLAGAPNAARRFLAAARRYREQRKQNEN